MQDYLEVETEVVVVVCLQPRDNLLVKIKHA